MWKLWRGREKPPLPGGGESPPSPAAQPPASGGAAGAEPALAGSAEAGTPDTGEPARRGRRHSPWSNITYNFRNSGDFADGVHMNTTLGNELDLALSQKLDALPLPAEYYCTAGTSASGCQALLFLAGAPSSSALSGFTVTAFTVEGQKDGFFFYGTSGRQAQPWGNGTSYKCVAPPTIRTPTVNSSGSISGCDGSISRDMSVYWTAFPGDNPGPGIPIDLQLWYRDPQNTSNQTTSFSNAVEFILEP